MRQHARRQRQQGVGAGQQVHARRDHRGGVDQRADRRRAGHRARQPEVERALGRLRATAAIRISQASSSAPPEPAVQGGVPSVVSSPQPAGTSTAASSSAPSPTALAASACRPAPSVPGSVAPERDQQEAGHADAGPADQQHRQVAGQHQQRHRGDEEVQVAKKRRTLASPSDRRVHVARASRRRRRSRPAPTTASISAPRARRGAGGRRRPAGTAASSASCTVGRAPPTRRSSATDQHHQRAGQAGAAPAALPDAQRGQEQARAA